MPYLRRFAALALALPIGATAQTLTLGEAQRIAEQANPALRVARAGLFAPEGLVAETARPLWNNPALSLDLARRRAPQERTREWGVGVSQALEVAGQHGHRREAARLELAATREAIAEAAAQLQAEVAERFARLLAAQERAAAERGSVRLIDDSSTAIGKRVAAGEASRLEGNLARVEALRARSQLAQADEALAGARAELAAQLQLPPGAQPVAAGQLVEPARYSREDLLETALGRPLLAVLRSREAAARSRLDLERAATAPDVTLGGNFGRDGPELARESTVGVSVSVPLPLFRRNESAIGRALTELTQAQVERQAGERDIRASVMALWDRHAILRARAARLREEVLPALDDNLRLSRIAFSAGEIGLVELLLVNRQLVEARREALEAQAEQRLAQIALERAAGWPPRTIESQLPGGTK